VVPFGVWLSADGGSLSLSEDGIFVMKKIVLTCCVKVLLSRLLSALEHGSSFERLADLIANVKCRRVCFCLPLDDSRFFGF
jgi:hypothetical protein